MSTPSTTTELASRRSLWLLWIAILAGPAAWVVHLTAGILLVPLACRMTSDLRLHLNTLAMAAVAVWALVALIRARNPDRFPADRHPGGFLVLAGILVAAISLALILAEGLPVLFIDPCQ